MFFVSLHVVGGVAFGAAPVSNGPRHCGQLSWDAAAAKIDPAVESVRANNPRDFIRAFSHALQKLPI
jgi:hypothetical protein